MAEDGSPFTDDRAGSAFLVAPPGGGKGPGVLILHSWWGLNDWARSFTNRVAAEGYTALTPDLMFGERPATEPEAEAALADIDPNELAGLVLSSAHTVRAASADPARPIAVIGFGMGASMALWLSARLPVDVCGVVTFYGAQSIDFDDATAQFLGHFGDADHLVSEEDRVVTESFIRLGENTTDFHIYPDAKHGFFEPGDAHDPEASELAWERTKAFLAVVLPAATD